MGALEEGMTDDRDELELNGLLHEVTEAFGENREEALRVLSRYLIRHGYGRMREGGYETASGLLEEAIEWFDEATERLLERTRGLLERVVSLMDKDRSPMYEYRPYVQCDDPCQILDHTRAPKWRGRLQGRLSMSRRYEMYTRTCRGWENLPRELDLVFTDPDELSDARIVRDFLLPIVTRDPFVTRKDEDRDSDVPKATILAAMQAMGEQIESVGRALGDGSLANGVFVGISPVKGSIFVGNAQVKGSIRRVRRGGGRRRSWFMEDDDEGE